MILPDKTITLKYSLIGIGSKILVDLGSPQTVSSLWEKVKDFDEIRTFDRYLLVLDFLYILGLIDFKEGLLKRARKYD